MKKFLLATLLIALVGASLVSTALAADPSATPVEANCPAQYIVRRGDTLASIARRCGLTTYSLKRYNGLTSDLIRVGQRLVTRAPAKAPAAPAIAADPSRSIKVPTAAPRVEPRIRP
jgi:LysM repeat protein